MSLNLLNDLIETNSMVSKAMVSEIQSKSDLNKARSILELAKEAGLSQSEQQELAKRILHKVAGVYSDEVNAVLQKTEPKSK